MKVTGISVFIQILNILIVCGIGFVFIKIIQVLKTYKVTISNIISKLDKILEELDKINKI